MATLRQQQAWFEILALNQKGQFAEALARIESGFGQGDPGLLGWKLRGQALYGLGRYLEAVQAFAVVVTRDPADVEAYDHLATALLGIGKLEQAALTVARGLQVEAGHPGLLRLQFILRWRLGQRDEALAWAEQHLRCFPEDGAVWHERGVYHLEVGADAEALADLERACLLMPDHSVAMGNRGTALWRLGRYSEAFAALQRAVELDRNNASAQHHRSLLLLFLGHWIEGFSAYEWRWRDPAHLAQQPSWAVPLWTGESLPEATLLIYPEQGYGDAIQFIRFVPLIRQRVSKVCFFCSGPLVPLLRLAPGVDCLWEGELPRPHFDCCVPLMSLPGLLHQTRDEVPGAGGYLPALAWKPPLRSVFRPRVGVAWRGRPTHRNDHNRSVGLSWFEPLLLQESIDWVSLQEGGERDMIGDDRFDHRIEMPCLTDFAVTARVMQTLDLVISVDTAVAHLAGAIGCPVWLLLPFVPDWRWGAEGQTTPWYSTMILFRQQKPGDWRDVQEQVLRALERWVSAISDSFHPRA
ncbi:MAG: glycosyltransferase family protein [Magnetococcales bacterium]|nr:glycosyltransferase family protein [Magnetococcales bacterium]